MGGTVAWAGNIGAKNLWLANQRNGTQFIWSRPSATQITATPLTDVDGGAGINPIIPCQATDGSIVMAEVTAALTAAITTVGANGLLSGESEAADTVYNIFLIWGADVGPALLMVTGTTVIGWAYPSGYTHLSRLLFFCYNDASSNLLDFSHVGGHRYAWTTSQTFLSGGTATSASTVSPPGNTNFEHFGYIQATNAQVTSRTLTIAVTSSNRNFFVKAADSVVDISPVSFYSFTGALRYVWSGAVTTGCNFVMTGWKIQ